MPVVSLKVCVQSLCLDSLKVFNFSSYETNWYYSKNWREMSRKWSLEGCWLAYDYCSYRRREYDASLLWKSRHLETYPVRITIKVINPIPHLSTTLDGGFLQPSYSTIRTSRIQTTPYISVLCPSLRHEQVATKQPYGLHYLHPMMFSLMVFITFS